VGIRSEVGGRDGELVIVLDLFLEAIKLGLQLGDQPSGVSTELRPGIDGAGLAAVQSNSVNRRVCGVAPTLCGVAWRRKRGLSKRGRGLHILQHTSKLLPQSSCAPGRHFLVHARHWTRRNTQECQTTDHGGGDPGN